MKCETRAILSTCRSYRYDLWRIWDSEKPFLMVIGLNPSTADETEDDPTIRRCKRFASDWGFGSLCMVNLFALRATDPKVMIADPSPIGSHNDQFLIEHAKSAGMILAAWGNKGFHMSRDLEVIGLIKQQQKSMMCLGKTNSGKPRHPLYVKADKLPELL